MNKLLLPYKQKVVPIFRYGVVGILGAFIHICATVALVEWFQLNPVLSSIIGFIVVLIISFFLNKKWTFQVKESNFLQFAKYLTVSLTGLALNTLIMYVTVNVLEWPYLYGMGVMVVAVALCNFSLNQLWTFRVRDSSKRTIAD